MCEENQITKTRFVTVLLDENATRGIPLSPAGGKCKAVVLKANHFKPDSVVNQIAGIPAYFYYGDQNQQSCEYLLNVGAAATPNPRASEIIYCQDISEVWLRLPTVFAEAQILVEAIIYE